MLAPDGVPSWVRDRKEFWNQTEEVDSRKNSCFGKAYTIVLQNELTLEQNKAIVKIFCMKNFVAHGHVCDIAIHEPPEDSKRKDNIHTHLMISSRQVDKVGRGLKFRPLDNKKFLMDLRAAWAEDVNTALMKAGRPERVSHKSLAEQKIE